MNRLTGAASRLRRSLAGNRRITRLRNLAAVMRLGTIAVLIILARTIFSFAGEDVVPPQKLNLAGLDIAVWTPPRATPGPWPVIVFSHGFHGCNTQSKFLMQALADNGYAVFAPDHRDATCGNLRALLQKPAVPFARPEGWSDATYADRRQDVEALIDALKADPTYGAPPFDWDELGLVGHSLGGYTVLGLSGAWPSWKDRRVKAVVGLSPYSTPYLQSGKLGDLGVPVMYQGGTLDFGITPFVAKAGGVYDQTRAPKYYVELDGAGHMAWTDLRSTYHQAIIDYTIAFLDHYLKGKPFPPALTVVHPGISAVRIAK
jgi:predicted dienelactone hydrolase